MQALKEIIFLLNQSNIHPFEHLKGGTVKGGVSKLLALYDGIAEGKFSTDAEAEKTIYSVPAGGSAYRKLKSDLREQLFDAVINLNTNQSDFSDYQKAYYLCHRQWVVVRILTGMNANTAAMSLATKLLKQADRFDFTLLCMDIASYLRIQYGLRESNDHKFKEANEQFLKYKKVYEAECHAEELYTLLIVRYVNNRSAQQEVHSLSLAYFDEIKVYMEQFKSYKLQMYGYLIGLLTHTSVSDYASAKDFCVEAIRFFDECRYEARTPLQIFHYQNLICNIQLKQFGAGEVSANKCIQYMKEGTFNWFKYQELFLHLSLHSKEYGQAEKTLRYILKHPRFEFLPDNTKELWTIYESYIYYLSSMGLVASPIAVKFNLARFERQTPIFSKDKGGLNIAIIIIRLLILLKQRSYRQILDELDAVNQYCYRHLRGENTRRSYYFIKMLLIIPFAQFDADEIEKKVATFQQKLSKIPFQVANQTHEVEIIPYEDLWGLMMKGLRTSA